jgi:hypothetical protein
LLHIKQGVITSVKDGFGFIRCADREARMFFHFSEMMTVKTEIQVNEEVEFTVVQVYVFHYKATFTLNASRRITLNASCLNGILYKDIMTRSV